MSTEQASVVPYSQVEDEIIGKINDEFMVKPATDELREDVQRMIDGVFACHSEDGKTVMNEDGIPVTGIRFYFAAGNGIGLELQLHK